MQKKNVLITGATGGIGEAIIESLSGDYNLFLTGRNEKKLEMLSEKFHAKGVFKFDLTNTLEINEFVKNIEEKTEGIDVLINNAGGYIWAPVEKTSDDDILNLIKLNIEAPYFLIKGFVGEMKKKGYGKIVNIGSISGTVGEANASLYSMTKSAYIGLTKSLALELAEYGININTINPGWVKTKLAEEAVEESDFTDMENIDMIPQKRYIEPYEIAELVKYLISDNARAITGQQINICAGLAI